MSKEDGMTKAHRLRAEALQLAEQGMSIREIAKRLGVPRITVFSWVPRAEESVQFKQMADMRAKGMTNIEIARELGTTRHRVGAVLGPTSRRGRRPENRRRIVARLSDKHLNRLSMTANDLGLPALEPSRMATAILEEIGAGRLEVDWKDGYNAFSHLVESRETAPAG